MVGEEGYKIITKGRLPKGYVPKGSKGANIIFKSNYILINTELEEK